MKTNVEFRKRIPLCGVFGISSGRQPTSSKQAMSIQRESTVDRSVGWIGGTYARLSLASQQKANGIERAYPKCEWKVFGPIYYIRSIEFIADGRMGCGAVVDGGGWWS